MRPLGQMSSRQAEFGEIGCLVFRDGLDQGASVEPLHEIGLEVQERRELDAL